MKRLTALFSALFLAAALVPFSASAYYGSGDINGDHRVDATDASGILEIYSMLSTSSDPHVTQEMRAVADVNRDGYIDSSDATAVLECYALMSTTAHGGYADEILNSWYGSDGNGPENMDDHYPKGDYVDSHSGIYGRLYDVYSLDVDHDGRREIIAKYEKYSPDTEKFGEKYFYEIYKDGKKVFELCSDEYESYHMAETDVHLVHDKNNDRYYLAAFMYRSSGTYSYVQLADLLTAHLGGNMIYRCYEYIGENGGTYRECKVNNAYTDYVKLKEYAANIEIIDIEDDEPETYARSFHGSPLDLINN